MVEGDHRQISTAKWKWARAARTAMAFIALALAGGIIVGYRGRAPGLLSGARRVSPWQGYWFRWRDDRTLLRIPERGGQTVEVIDLRTGVIKPTSRSEAVGFPRGRMGISSPDGS